MSRRYLNEENNMCTQYLIRKDAADFETAVAATGYGRFNVFLLLCAFPAFWSAVSVPSSTSFILSSAHCHLQMSFLDMGLLNAITYVGMISSAMLWGFLSDTLGRRNIICWGFILTGIVEVTSALSQSLLMLIITQFSSGFFFNGPFAAVISYLAELHRTEHRARVLLYTNLFFTIAQTTLPLVAWSLLAHNIHIPLFGNIFRIYSWNIFLMSQATGPIITGILFFFLPESPRFLMSRRRNEEALEVFRQMYAMNTGRKPMDYPIQTLEEEDTEPVPSGLAALRAGFWQIAPLFKVPYGFWLLVICFTHLGCMFSMNTLRLWYPILASLIESSQQNTICAALEQSNYADDNLACNEIATELITYLQSSIVGAGSMITYLVGGALVNVCGKKNIIGFSGVTSALLVALLPILGTSDVAVVLIVTVIIALNSLFSATLSSVVADFFSTSLRVSALATFLMHGRMGTVAGLIIFPALIQYGCYPPFILISLVLAACGYISFLLPDTTLKKLK